MNDFSYVENVSPEQTALLAQGDELIGLYRNPPEPGACDLLVTSERVIMLAPEGITSLPYRDIADLQVPGEKREANYILVRLISGNEVRLPVYGHKLRTRDAFEFLRYLRRVSTDAQTR